MKKERASPWFIAIVALAILVFIATVRMGAFVAGGADSSGYLSQARLWERGSLITHEPLILKVDWPYAEWTFVPLGYRPGIDKGDVVPIYSVGYPMVMGVARRLLGSGSEKFVVPLAAAGLVVCTGMLGWWIGGPLTAVGASLVLATSPPFVLQSLQPMSDVPTAFWWALATVAGSRRTLLSGVVAAAAVALAILTRPNLAPLALPLILLILAAHRREQGSRNWTGAMAVCAGAIAGAGLTAYLNNMFFGGPAVSGYGAPHDLYQLSFWPVNLARYGRWLIDTETVLVAIAALFFFYAFRKTFVAEWAIYTAAVFAIVAFSYLFYRPFDNWTYLRFFLPAYPLLFIALVAGVNFVVSAKGRRWTFAAVTLLTAAITAAHINFIGREGVLQTKSVEEKYLRLTNYVARSLPPNAIFISHQYTGSIRYYTDRRILRYDWLVPNRLDNAVSTLTALGYKPYFLLEDWEEPVFRDRFADSALAKLDWYPTAEFRLGAGGHVRIYDPAKR